MNSTSDLEVPARWLGLFGLGLALISAVSWAVAPIHVSSGEIGPDASAHYETHRTLLLAFGFAAAVGNALHAAFFVALRTIVRGGRTEQALARLGMVCLLIVVVLVIVAFSIFSALAYGQPSTEVAATLTDLAWILINQAAGPVTTIGLIAITVALARSRLVRRWVVAYTVFVGGAHLVVAAAVAEEGAFSPAGTVAFVVPMLFFSWFAVVGYELIRASHSVSAERPPP
jgi:hypothetical protein